MALADNLTTFKSDFKTNFRTKMETAYNLTVNPDYSATELEKFGNVMAELVAEIVYPYIVANAELNSSSLADTGVTVDTGTGVGNVDDGTVNGGII